MSSYWSMYVVPDDWRLRDCMLVAYSYHIQALMSNDEFKQHMEFERAARTLRYDELVQQPCLYEFAADDGGDPDLEKIMEILPLSGRLYRFDDRLYEMIFELKKFAKDHEGKRYICMN